MTPPAVAKAHEETARSLLHVEALGLHVLKGAVAQVGRGDPIVVARRSHDIVAATVLDIRKAARTQGALRFGAEVDASGASIPLPDLSAPVDADRLAAERAARGYSDALVKQAQEWFAEHDAAEADPVLRADVAYLESIAATETSAAFNDERTRIEMALAKEHEDSSWWPFLTKTWCCDLETAHRARRMGKKTRSGRPVSGPCPTCRALDKKTLGWGSDWPGGVEPGDVHPNCVPPGTLIATPRGDVPIEALAVGDLVLGGLTGEPRGVTALHRNPHRGDMFTIHVGGHRLRLTGNHPVLTPGGWVPADQLKPGNEVVCQLPQRRVFDAHLVAGPAEHGPSRFSQEGILFGVADRMHRRSVPVTGVDLDRDPLRHDREVDIELAERVLRNNLDARRRKCRGEYLFDGGQPHVDALAASLRSHATGGVPRAADSVVSSLCESRPTLRSLMLHAEHVGIAATSLDAPCLSDRPHNGCSLNAKTAREGQNRHLFFGVKPEDFGVVQFDPRRAALNTRFPQGGVDAGSASADQRRDLIDRLHLFGVQAHDLGAVQAFSGHSASVTPSTMVAMPIDAIEVHSYRGHVLNLSVETDESYIAQGVSVHNCRCFVRFSAIPFEVIRKKRAA